MNNYSPPSDESDSDGGAKKKKRKKVRALFHMALLLYVLL